MKHIISRTLETTIKKASIIVVTIVGMIVGLIMKSYVVSKLDNNPAFTSMVNSACAMQHMMVFFILAGSVLMITAVSVCSDLIAGEYAEGTLRLLVAKPNTRSQILIGKMAGSYIGLVILYLLELFAYFSTFMIMAKCDGNLIKAMFSYFPGYILYGLIVIFILLSITTLLSCIFKKKLGAMLPMLAIVFIIIAFFPIQRLISDLSGGSYSTSLDLIDLNYHLALIFKTCVQLCGNYTMASGDVVSYLMKLFRYYLVDADVYGSYSMQLMEYTSLNNYVVLIVYLIISAFATAGSFAIIKRKDI